MDYKKHLHALKTRIPTKKITILRKHKFVVNLRKISESIVAFVGLLLGAAIMSVGRNSPLY
jgi:hypothetical protein